MSWFGSRRPESPRSQRRRYLEPLLRAIEPLSDVDRVLVLMDLQQEVEGRLGAMRKMYPVSYLNALARRSEER